MKMPSKKVYSLRAVYFETIRETLKEVERKQEKEAGNIEDSRGIGGCRLPGQTGS